MANVNIVIQERNSDTPLTKEFFVSFSHSILKDTVNFKLKEKQKVAKLPGFRDGQVPFFVIEKKYKESVLADSIREKVEEVIENVTQPYKGEIVGKAEVRNFKNIPEKGVEFELCFETFPKFEMPSFDQITIDQYSIEVAEQDLSEQLKVIALNRREFDQNFDASNAKEGDLVTIDFESKLDGVIHRHGSAKNYKCEIGKGALLKEFEENLIGIGKGESKEFEMRFPESYDLVKEVAGKVTKVRVVVHDVQRYLPAPEINDAFANYYGCKDLSELKYKVSEITREGIEKDLFLINKTKLFDALENLLNFEVPVRLLQAEYESLKNNAALKEQLGYSEEQYEQYCKKLSLRKLKIGIMIADYAKLNNIKISEQEFQNHVMSQIEKHPDRKSEILEYYKNNAANWYSAAVEEKVVKQILSAKVKLCEVEKTSAEMRQIVSDFSKRYQH